MLSTTTQPFGTGFPVPTGPALPVTTDPQGVYATPPPSAGHLTDVEKADLQAKAVEILAATRDTPSKTKLLHEWLTMTTAPRVLALLAENAALLARAEAAEAERDQWVVDFRKRRAEWRVEQQQAADVLVVAEKRAAIWQAEAAAQALLRVEQVRATEAQAAGLKQEHKTEVLDILRDMRLPPAEADPKGSQYHTGQVSGRNQERQAINNYCRAKAYEYDPQGIGPDPVKDGEWDTLPKAPAVPILCAYCEEWPSACECNPKPGEVQKGGANNG